MLSLPRNQHDSLAGYVFGRPKAAAIELRHVLPPPLIDALDLTSLRPAPASTTRPSLGRRDSDLLFDVDLRGLQALPIRVAIDHQSTPDALMPWRTLVYTGEQWGSYIKAQSSSPSTLPLVLPVLLVQRPARSTPSRLSDILALPPELREHFASPIELTLYVDDLSRSVLDDPCADSGHLALVEATRTLLHAYKNDDALTLQRLTTLGRLFDSIVDHFGPEPEEARELLAYITATFGVESPIHAIIMQTFSRETKEMYMTLADKWRTEGFDKGIAEGFGKGIAEGFGKGIAAARAEAVLGVLGRRGLEVPRTARERVLATSDESLLERWFDRAFTVTSVEDIFERHDV